MSNVGGFDGETEIADLRRRLAEAEDTLQAIRQGEVDAFVMRSSAAEQVFTLEGDAEFYRTFMEVMEPGAAALDGAGRVLYVNGTLSRLLGRPVEEVQGLPVAAAVGGPAGEAIAGLVLRADGHKQTREIKFEGFPDGDRYFLASVTPLRIATIDGHALTFTDVTDRVRAEAAEQAERAARAVIASANEAVLVCDREGIVTHANAAARIVCADSPVGRPFADAVPLVFPGATGLTSSDDVVAMAVGGAALRGIEAVAPHAPKVHDYLISAAPLQVTGDQISGCVITMVDLTQRKAAEKQQLLLMGELDHRVKNTLALVLSISGRTISNEDTLEGFQKAFTGRIQALAATHTLLADKSWSNLSLRDVVMAELAPYVGGGGGRVLTKGLEVAVAPRAAIALGLVAHELTTNAVKYGALSREGGRLTVEAEGRNEDGALVVEWRESGGPVVIPPTRSGFGRTVIARSLQYSPQGSAEVEFAPAGVVCRITIPAEDLP